MFWYIQISWNKFRRKTKRIIPIFLYIQNIVKIFIEKKRILVSLDFKLPNRVFYEKLQPKYKTLRKDKRFLKFKKNFRFIEKLLSSMKLRIMILISSQLER